MKNNILLSIILISLVFNGWSSVQIYTFNDPCNVSNFSSPNSGWNECFVNFEFLGETIEIGTVSHPIEVENDTVVFGFRRMYFAFSNAPNTTEGWFGFQGFFYAHDFESGEIVDNSYAYNNAAAVFLEEEYMVGGPWPDIPLSTHWVFNYNFGFRVKIGDNWHYGYLTYELYSDGLNNFVQINEIGIETIPNFPIMVDEINSIINGDFEVNGTFFLDNNEDGLFNSGDEEFGLSDLSIDNGNVSIQNYATSNPFQLNLVEGNYNISANFDLDIWSATTSISNSVNLNPGNPIVNGSDFGFTPIGNVISAQGGITAQTARCNLDRNHNISITNDGNTPVSGYFEYTIDPICTGGGVGADSIVGNKVYFSFTNLSYFETEVFNLTVQIPGVDFIGETIFFTLKVFDQNGSLMSQETMWQIISCAYDPNDKTEFNGYTENGYINAGDELEYLIRFQNTGNDTAYNIFLNDQLSPLLDWESFLPVSSSHEYEAILFDDGRLYVGFDDIFLVDSIANEPESHGYFQFKIKAQEGLSPGTIIENYTEIYFDFNPPIFTNTTITEVIDCDALVQIEVDDTFCLGDEIVATNGFEFIEEYNWSINGTTIGSDSQLNFSPEQGGDQYLVLEAVNPLCNVSDSVLITILSGPLAFAGIDTAFCGLDGNLNAIGMTNGNWSGPSEITFSDGTDPNAFIISNSQGSFELIWTETDGLCSAQDTVTVTFFEIPWVEIAQNGGTLIANTFGNNYQWYLEGELIIGATGESYQPLETGNYTVTVEGQNGCVGESDSFFFTYVGLEEMNVPSFTISPNPFNDFTVIRFNHLNDKNYRLELLDQSGKKVKAMLIEQEEIRLQKDELSNGIYHLNLLNESGVIIHSEKLIIR